MEVPALRRRRRGDWMEAREGDVMVMVVNVFCFFVSYGMVPTCYKSVPGGHRKQGKDYGND